MFDPESCQFELHDIQPVAKGAPAGSRATAVPFASLTQSKTAADRQGSYCLFRKPHPNITSPAFRCRLTAFNADQQQETLGRKVSVSPVNRVWVAAMLTVTQEA